MRISEIKEHLGDTLPELEAFRKEQLATISASNSWLLLPLAILILAIILLLMNYFTLATIAFCAAFFKGILVFYNITRQKKEIEQVTFKKRFLTSVVKAIYPTVNFYVENKMNLNLLRKSGIAPTLFNGDKPADAFEGTSNNGRRFKFIEYGTTDKNNSNYSQLFFSIEAPILLDKKDSILLVPNYTEKVIGTIGRRLQELLGGYFKNTKVVDLSAYPEFQKQYVLYATNPDIAQHLFSPATIQAITKIKEKFKHRARLSIIEDRIYILIENPYNFFEFNIRNSLLGDWVLKKLKNELASCFDLVEDFSQIEVDKKNILIDNSKDTIYKHLLDNDDISL
jgi:hypothetical protein